ncbi:MAG: hypothetical protein KC417_14555, partial [Myxococcales bacterium]|nr:hypothetical protein [Myxococcales bacterium]
DHYYTRAVQERAFRRASELAQRLGDATSEQRFRSTADEIRTSLLGYWDEQEGVLRTHLPESFVRGKDYKASGLDTTVLMARMHTGADAKAILDDQLLATATRLEDAFHEQYAVNHVEKAPLVGRYPEDRYTGLPHQDREGGGNPWLITTNAFAELHYRVADALGSEGAVTFTDRNAAFYLTALDSKRTARGHAALEELGDLLGLHDGERTLRTDSDAFERLQSALVDRGDSFLERVQENITAEGRHTEQIHRDTGAPIGAEQLTWNEASLLSAYRARRAALR